MPDPEYKFERLLTRTVNGLTNRPLKLVCSASDGASVTWMKDGQALKEGGRLTIDCDGGEHRLKIDKAMITDTGTYSCTIVKFGVEGQRETVSKLYIAGGYSTGLMGRKMSIMELFQSFLINLFKNCQINWTSPRETIWNLK